MNSVKWSKEELAQFGLDLSGDAIVIRKSVNKNIFAVIFGLIFAGIGIWIIYYTATDRHFAIIYKILAWPVGLAFIAIFPFIVRESMSRYVIDFRSGTFSVKFGNMIRFSRDWNDITFIELNTAVQESNSVGFKLFEVTSYSVIVNFESGKPHGIYGSKKREKVLEFFKIFEELIVAKGLKMPQVDETSYRMENV